MESCNKEYSLQSICGTQRSKNTSRNEDEPKEKGLEKMEFEIMKEGSDSFDEELSE